MVRHAQLRFTDHNAVSLQCSFQAAGHQEGLEMDETAIWSADGVTSQARHSTHPAGSPEVDFGPVWSFSLQHRFTEKSFNPGVSVLHAAAERAP